MIKNQEKRRKEQLSSFPQIIADRFPFLTVENPLNISLEYIMKNFSFSDNLSKEDVITHISSCFDDLIKSNILKSWTTEDEAGSRFSIFITPEFVSEIKETNLSKRRELNKIVLDTSAILALLAMEEGHEVVAENLENAVVSSVTFFEVLEILISKGLDYKEAAQSLKDTFPNIEQFDAEQVIIVSSLNNHKLSFGDRACLALAKSRNLSVLTANTIWKELDLGAKIQLIR